MAKLIISGRLPGLNEYIKANRNNKYDGARMKEGAEQLITAYIKQQLRENQFNSVVLEFNWYEENQRRDKDNIAFAKKFILDALQANGVIPKDGWKHVKGFRDEFYIDKQRPRVEVIIREVQTVGVRIDKLA